MQLRSFASFFWIVLILYCVYLMAMVTLPYLSMRLNVDFLITKQSIIHLKHWRWAFYLHVFTSLFVLMAGLIQFNTYFLRHYKKLHRLSGKAYVIIVLLISGPAALVMSIYANGDLRAKASFVLLSLLWILFTGLSYRQAIRKNFVAHRNFMIRSYALTLSAITLRAYAFILPHFTHMEAKDEYALIAWASWTINLLIAEIIIYSTRKKPINF